MLSVIDSNTHDINGITIGNKRRKQFLLDTELMDSEVASEFRRQIEKPTPLTGPVVRLDSPETFEADELEFWQQDEVTDEERLALQPIILNPAMHELRGTTESVILAKWHLLSGHINSKYLKQVAPRIKGMEEVSRLSSKTKLPICETCNHGNSKHKPLPKKSLKRSTKLLHRIHCDMSGYIQLATNDSANYCLLFIEDKTGYKFVSMLHEKDDYLDALNHLIIQIGMAPEILRLDNAGEFH